MTTRNPFTDPAAGDLFLINGYRRLVIRSRDGDTIKVSIGSAFPTSQAERMGYAGEDSKYIPRPWPVSYIVELQSKGYRVDYLGEDQEALTEAVQDMDIFRVFRHHCFTFDGKLDQCDCGCRTGGVNPEW